MASREASMRSGAGSPSRRMGLVDPTMSRTGSALGNGADADDDDYLGDLGDLFGDDGDDGDSFGGENGAKGAGSGDEDSGQDYVFEDEAAMTKTTKKTRSLFSGLLTWGRPDNNRLGTSGEFAYKNNRLSRVDRNAMQASQTVPLAVSGIPEKAIRQVACADKVTMVLLVSGQVWMWGNGMARPAREERLDVRVTQIAAGSAHFVAVTDERTRNLFSWGANTSGQLGHGDTNRQERPKRVVTIGSNTVVHATCGAQYTMAVTARGRLYAWGDNSYGQLGLGVQKEEVVYNRRVTKWVPDTKSRSKPALVESLMLPPYAAFDLVRNKSSYKHLMVATGQEHASAWLTDPTTGEISEVVTPSIRKGQEAVRRLQAEVRELRKELAEARQKLERFHVSDAGEQRPATMSGLVHRQLTEDSTLKGTADLVETARTCKANAERELNDALEQLELINRQVESLSEELELVAKNSKALWSRIDTINDALAGELKQEAVTRFRRELDDKMELARASDTSYEQGMLRLHERTVEQHRLQRAAEGARTEMEAADKQIRTLNQLKADRRARLRTEYSREQHSDVEALAAFSKRTLDSLKAAEVRAMAMDGETLETLRRRLDRPPGLNDLVQLSESRITDIALKLEHEIGEGLTDEDAAKTLAEAMLALLKDNAELRKHVNFLVRGVMTQTQQRLCRVQEEEAMRMARDRDAHTPLDAGSTRVTPASVEVHLEKQGALARAAADGRSARTGGLRTTRRGMM